MKVESISFNERKKLHMKLIYILCLIPYLGACLFPYLDHILPRPMNICYHVPVDVISLLLDVLRGCSIITSRLGVGSSHRDRPISMVLLLIFRDSEREAGGWVVKNGNFSMT